MYYVIVYLYICMFICMYVCMYACICVLYCIMHKTTVQLMSKFTNILFSSVYSSILFEALVSTRISHVSKEIARVVLLCSLDFIADISRGSLQELTICVKSQANESSIHLTSTAFQVMYLFPNQLQMYCITSLSNSSSY